MKYCIYKMRFLTGVHFGGNSLDGTGCSFRADTLFSALCTEALKDGEEKLLLLYDRARSDRIRFSDAFPYVGDEFLLPKPMLRIRGNDDLSGEKKLFKKMDYISFSLLDSYKKGEMRPSEELELERNIGKGEVRTSAWISGREETLPYRVGVYSFSDNAGLYVILGYEEDEDRELFEGLFEHVSYTGIGGRRSSGLGRFDLLHSRIPDELVKSLDPQSEKIMTLSVSLPKENELDEVIKGASYLVDKRSGFVYSDSYSGSPMRKRDLFVFRAGSVFTKQFSGDVYDVSADGTHPVYRYTKPLFLGV